MRIVIGIPTIGRAAVLCETLLELRRQTRAPNGVIVCGTKASDLENVSVVAASTIRLIAAPGLPRQRNAIIDAATDADVIVFFDDDFLPDPGYLAAIGDCMTVQQNVVVATGVVLADGINGPGLSPDEGRAHLAHAILGRTKVTPTFSAYGCNMAVRLAPIRTHNVRFDERLPLYGWQEDVDFSRRLAEFGAVVTVNAAQGVHLGVKSGCNIGIQLGYSQVANPLYLSRKRRGYPMRRALGHITKNIAMNIMRSAWPEPYVDRRGRLWGNILAMRDLITGQMIPERVLEL